ncbi:MAG: ABC transporter ATP-binding protein/permease [Methanomicrobiales archaeon]|jgi:ATP-binding cassette subfamily B protein|nr:ABC transporter ATP-binding protein/permease [Methanomicrobiales archaeon]
MTIEIPGSDMIRKLASYIKEYTLYTFLAPFFMVLEVVVEVLMPLMMVRLIDAGIEAGDMDVILEIGLILIILAVLSLIFGALSGVYAAKASAGYAKNLRHAIFYHVQNFSFENIDTFSTPSIVTRLTTDVTNVQNAFQMVIRIAVRSPIMIILSLCMVYMINHTMFYIFLGIVPVLGLGLFLIINKAHPIFVRIFQEYDNLNRVVQENLRGIRVVKSYVREEYEEEKFERVSTEIFHASSAAEKLLAFLGPLMQFCIYACILLISWFAAHMIVAETMTTGELVSMFTYAMQILMGLMMFSMVFVMITMSRASAKRITEILDEESRIKNPKNPVYHVKNGDIEFSHVRFSYTGNDTECCLYDINITIRSGETIGILGGTGSSKTTLVQLIPRLYDVTSGSVKVGGVDVREYDLTTLRSAVSMVLQKNVLFSGTIRDNICWGGKDATDEEVAHVCALAQADGFIREFPGGYETNIEQGGTNLSGGQKQRLCIARALLKKPQILILDDSTSSVDTKTDALLQKALYEEMPKTTKLIISQRISSIERADRIIVMDRGMISALGTHEELLKISPVYQEVYQSQVQRGIQQIETELTGGNE